MIEQAVAGVLELRGELNAAIDLDGPQGEGQPLLKRLEELRTKPELAE